ncbi:MAG: ribonuclease P protein component [bacterium]|nr:ribonuclease P protein component [bacterium]
MLPSQQRLRRRSDIERLFKEGTKVHNPLIRMIYQQNQGSESRVAVVVSKRVSAHAVDRNSVKRRIRSAISQKIEDINIPHDILLIAQAQSKSATYAELDRAVDRLLIKINKHGAK